MFRLLKAYCKYDPAAQSRLEVLLCYPGIKAIAFHRLAHLFYHWKVPIVPRLISEFARFITGIEIHPGAQIGKNVIFDHGLGAVVGETSIVGDGVIIYQGVTLGGTTTERVKRHPTLECGVVVGAGAKVLGNITIGKYSRIGANSVVIADVPSHSTVVGIPGRVIKRAIEEGRELCHDEILEKSFIGENV